MFFFSSLAFYLFLLSLPRPVLLHSTIHSLSFFTIYSAELYSTSIRKEESKTKIFFRFFPPGPPLPAHPTPYPGKRITSSLPSSPCPPPLHPFSSGLISLALKNKNLFAMASVCQRKLGGQGEGKRGTGLKGNGEQGTENM